MTDIYNSPLNYIKDIPEEFKCEGCSRVLKAAGVCRTCEDLKYTFTDILDQFSTYKMFLLKFADSVYLKAATEARKEKLNLHETPEGESRVFSIKELQKSLFYTISTSQRENQTFFNIGYNEASITITPNKDDRSPTTYTVTGFRDLFAFNDTAWEHLQDLKIGDIFDFTR